MAVFAFGADYDRRDVFNDFIKHNCVGIGWSYKDNTAGHNIIKSMRCENCAQREMALHQQFCHIES